MLTLIRKHLHGVVAWVILILIAFVFILWGTVGLRLGNDRYIDVNGERLYPGQIELFKRMFPNADLAQVVLAKQQFNQAGFYLSDEQLDEMLKYLPYFQIDGKFSEQAYQRLLKTNPEQIKLIRKLAEVNYLQQQVSYGLHNSNIVFPNMLKRYYELMDQKRNISTLTVNSSSYLKNAEVTELELENYYNNNKNNFKIPAEVKLEYIQINYADILNNITVPQNEIEKYYNIHKSEFVVPAKKKLAQIVINKSDKPDKSSKIDVVKKLLNNKNFSKIAKEYSDDIITARKDGVIGWYQYGDMGDDLLDNSIKNLSKAGDVSSPIEYNNKYYIFKILETKPKYELSLDDVKDEIKSRIAQEHANDKYSELKEQLEHKSFEIADNLDVVAEELNLKVAKTDWFFQNSNLPSELLSNPKIISTAFSDDVYNERNNSSVIELSPESAVVIRVSDIKSERVKSFSEAKAEITILLKRIKAKERANAVVDKIWQNFIKNKAELLSLQSAIDQVAKLKDFNNIKNSIKIQKAKEISYLDTFWGQDLNNIDITDKKDGESNNLDSLNSKEELYEAFSLPQPDKNHPIQAKILSLSNGDQAILAIDKVIFGNFKDASSEDIARAKNQLKYFMLMRDSASFFNDINNQADKIKSF